MSDPAAATRLLGMQPRPRQAATQTDPHLAFMLAHQATNRLRLELRDLEESAAAARDPAFTSYEADIAIGQIDALEVRIRPFSAFVDQAIRFEAQEILVVLEDIRRELAGIVERLEPIRPKGVAEVAARLMRRRG